MGRAQEAPPLAGRDLFQGKVLEGVIGLERAKRLLSKNLNALLSLYKAFHLKCFPASKGSNPATPHEVGSHYCSNCRNGKCSGTEQLPNQPLFLLLLNRTMHEHRFPWNLFFIQWDLDKLYPAVVPNGIPAAGGRRVLCEAAAVVLARGSPRPGQLRAVEVPGFPWRKEKAEDFPKNPHGDDLFVPPVSLDSSGDASHLTSKYNKKEELGHLNPFHSKIFLNRCHCTAPLNPAFFLILHLNPEESLCSYP